MTDAQKKRLTVVWQIVVLVAAVVLLAVLPTIVDHNRVDAYARGICDEARIRGQQMDVSAYDTCVASIAADEREGR